MTDYRATPEQWAEAANHASKNYGAAWQCLLELRARVEALEANSKPTPNDRQIRSSNYPEKPDSSLVERVADAINSEAGSCFATIEARAAIREVAAWLRDQSPVMHRSGPHWAKVLEQEADQ